MFDTVKIGKQIAARPQMGRPLALCRPVLRRHFVLLAACVSKEALFTGRVADKKGDFSTEPRF